MRNYKNPTAEAVGVSILSWGEEGHYSHPSNWKNQLSAMFGGKTGMALSKAIIKAGYDGVITINSKGKTSEMVDLRHLQSTN